MPAAEHASANDFLRREWRQLGRLALESAIVGLFVSLVLALAVFVVSFEAQADDNGDARPHRQLIRDEGGARATGEQRFDDAPADAGRTPSRVPFESRSANDDDGNAWTLPVWRQGTQERNTPGVTEC
jgi:hypothetical protein